MAKSRSTKKAKAWTSAAARRLLTAAGNPPTVDEAVQVVVGRVLEGVATAPTDLDTLRSRLNVSGFYPEDMPFSGELRPDGYGFKIVYASHLSPARRRFTVAHELGHAIFETTGPNCPKFGEELERLCNMLATEILMPRDEFLKWSGGELSMQKVFGLARKFETSLAATAIRCAELRKVSVFEVENRSVAWGYGIVKAGSLKRTGYWLGQAVDGALGDQAGEAIVRLSDPPHWGEWRLEWSRIGQGTRTLFLLQPASARNAAHV